MDIKTIICLLAIFLPFTACNSGIANSHEETSNAVPDVYATAITKRISLDSFHIKQKITSVALHTGSMYGSVYAVDTFLLCTTVRDSMAIHVYSINTNSKLGEIVKVGTGKGECLRVYSVFSSGKSHTPVCWVYDINQKKIFKIDITRALSQLPNAVTEEITLQGDRKNMNSPVFINDTSFAACSYQLRDCRYFYTNLHSDQIRKEGRLPNPKPEWPKDNKQGQFNMLARTFNGKLFYNPSGKQIAIAYKTTDRIDIYDHDSLIKIVRGPAIFDPIKNFVLEEGVQISREYEHTRYAFTDITGDENYLYVIYSGLDEFKAYGRKILVFDWKGTPVASYDVDFGLCDLAMIKSKNQINIYSIDGETNDLILSHLPSLN